MRASWLFVAGAVMLMAAPAVADPAYKAQDVVKYLEQAKAAKLGQSRKICFEGDPDCAPAAAPKPFDLLVNFEFDSDHLTAAAKENLGQFAKALRNPEFKGYKFSIDGFTDATGTEVYNQNLSERRADSVVNYLSQLGVERDTLIPKGYGPTKPRSPDPYNAVNRRVETHLAD